MFQILKNILKNEFDHSKNLIILEMLQKPYLLRKRDKNLISCYEQKCKTKQMVRVFDKKKLTISHSSDFRIEINNNICKKML